MQLSVVSCHNYTHTWLLSYYVVVFPRRSNMLCFSTEPDWIKIEWVILFWNICMVFCVNNFFSHFLNWIPKGRNCLRIGLFFCVQASSINLSVCIFFVLDNTKVLKNINFVYSQFAVKYKFIIWANLVLLKFELIIRRYLVLAFDIKEYHIHHQTFK